MAQPAATAQIAIDGQKFAMDLADNDTASAFAAKLPLSVEMSELNGNEKFVQLDETLPGSAANPSTIEAGDVMLYGGNCLVLFYKTHPTTYAYARIGKVTNANALATAIGTGPVTATFSLAE